MKFNPQKPYNNLPFLPPLKVELETGEVLRKAIKANTKLAELKGLINLIPNPEILINTLILNEAKDSSEIENIVTTQDKVYQAFSAQTNLVDPSTKEVMRYREALWAGYQTLKKGKILTLNTILKSHEILVENNAGIRKVPGVNLCNEKTGEIVYTPPEGHDIIKNKLSNLEKYMNGADLTDSLINLAIIHYQFEAIHPFSDGNGRLGRILNVLFLIHKGLLDLPVLYLSSYIIKNKSKYYKLLLNVTKNNEWEKWILFILDAVEKTSIETIDKVYKIKKAMDDTVQEVKNKLPKIYTKELVELLFHQPYCKIKYLEERGIAQRQTASEYLKALEKIGILESKKIGKENLFLNKKLFDLWK